MAKVGNNLITTRLSGMLGDQIVFRTRGTKTYVATAPTRHEGPPTEQQLQHRHQFQEAIVYGKNVNANPEQKELYEQAAKENQTAFNVAVADFMKAPHIDEIDLSQYTGQQGDQIRVRAVDDFMVAGVTVGIYAPDGSLIEEGAAVKQANGLDWLYAAAQQNSNLHGSKIVIRANDLPGNTAVDERDL